MITQDDRGVDRQRIVLRAFDKCIDDLPVWIWIIWIPQFIAAVIKGRSESKTALEILKRIAREYPQSLYYYLKRFKHQSTSTQSAQGSIEGNLGYLQDIYDEIKRNEPILYECLELFSDFIPTLNVRKRGDFSLIFLDNSRRENDQ